MAGAGRDRATDSNAVECRAVDGSGDTIRVLSVGRSSSDGSWLTGEGRPLTVVGEIQRFDEVVSALDDLRPHVVVLGSEHLGGAFRLGSSPTAVVVVPRASRDAIQSGSQTQAAAVTLAVQLAGLLGEVLHNGV